MRGLRRAEARIKAFGKKVASLGKRMTALAGVMATPFVAGVTVYADFEKQMATVETMLSEPQKYMESFRKAIREMAVEFGESTETLAAGLYDILSASIPAEKALAVLAVSAKAAQAGLTDTGTAADAITTILNAYGLSADHAADVSDWLFSIVKRGKTTFGQLAPTIGKVATIARSAGLGLDELGASIATLTRSGIQTEEAITAINAVLSSFLKPSAEGAKLAEQLGFSLDAATLQAQGLLGVFQQIASLPPEAIATLFPNIRAIRGVLPALKNLSGFSEDVAAMANRAGATADAYAKMSRTLSKQLNRLKQVGLSVLSVLGEAIAGPVGIGVQVLTQFGTQLRDLILANKQWVAVIALAVAAIGVIGTTLLGVGLTIQVFGFALGGLATVIVKAVALFSLLGTVLGAIVSPIGLVVTAVAALGAYLIYASGAGGKAIAWLGERFSVLKEDAMTAYQGIANAMAAGDMALAARILWLTLKTEWIRGVAFLEKLWLDFRNFFVSIGTDAWHGLLAVAESVWHGIEVGWIETTAFFSKAWSSFTGFFAKTWQRIKAGARKAWNWIKSLFDDSIDLTAENDLVEHQKQQAIQRIDDDQQRKSAEREAMRQSERERSDAIHDATMAGIGTENLEAQRKLDEAYRERLQENENELQEARRQWQEAVEEARQKRQDKEANGPEPLSGPDGLLEKARQAMAGIGDRLSDAASQIDTKGTFVASNLLGLQAGDATDRMANGINKIERNTRPLRDAGEISFA